MIQAKTFEQKLKIVASRLLLAFIIASLMMTPQIGQSTVTATAKPAKPIQLYLDGRASVAPVPPQMLNNTVYVPLRHVSSMWNSKLNWNASKKQITIQRGANTFVLTLDQRAATKNNRPITLNAAPRMVRNTTMVPVRFIGENFGATVSWNAKNLRVSIHNYADQLPVVGSADNFKKIIAKQLEAQSRNQAYFRGTGNVNGGPVAMESNAPTSNKQADSSGGAAGGGAAGGNDFSKTNTQVAGVDEADIVKTDGKFIYQVRKNQVTISRVAPAEDMEVVNNVRYTNDVNFYPNELYVDGNTMVVIGYTYENMYSKQPIDEAVTSRKMVMDPYYGGWARHIVKAIVYDIRDRSQLKQIREFRLDGNLVSSRKIGSQLYIVANKYFYYNPAVKGAELPAPTFFDTGTAKEWQNVDYSEIRYFPDSIAQNYLLIAGISLNDREKDANVNAYLGSGEQVFASTDNLYVTMTKYEYKTQQTDTKDAESGTDTGSGASTGSGTGAAAASPAVEGDALPTISLPVIGRPWIWNPADVSTTIYKFALQQGVVNFVAKGSVPGTVLNQFSMDEHNDHFRVATTKTTFSENWQSKMTNHLYILGPDMKLKGNIDDIAPGERIYSVRFMGDRAYMVTFKTVDPLFVIDVADPAKPSILGELKIPGYSNYLHPYDENHIIGIGKDTIERSFEDPYSGTTNSFAYYTGMKMALFDVTDVNNPIEKFVEKIGDRGTDSELLYNHKALLFSKEKNLFALPITLMEMASEKPEYDWQYGQFAFQGAYVYKLDVDNGFQLQTKITHYSDKEIADARGNWSFYGNNSNINRILYINDQLYTVSNKKIQANDLGTYEFTNELEFVEDELLK